MRKRKDLPKDASPQQQAEIQRLLGQFSAEETQTGIIQRQRKTPHPRGTVNGEDVRLQLEEARLQRSISEALRTMRATRGITLAQLADRQGLSTARVGQIEQGDARLELRSIVRQAAALGYEVRITFSPMDTSSQSIEAQVQLP